MWSNRAVGVYCRDVEGKLGAVVRCWYDFKVSCRRTSSWGDTQHVIIVGAHAAMEFEATCTTSVLGTSLQATLIRQVEFILETPGIPKPGFWHSAPAGQFDEKVWEQTRDPSSCVRHRPQT